MQLVFWKIVCCANVLLMTCAACSFSPSSSFVKQLLSEPPPAPCCSGKPRGGTAACAQAGCGDGLGHPAKLWQHSNAHLYDLESLQLKHRDRESWTQSRMDTKQYWVRGRRNPWGVGMLWQTGALGLAQVQPVGLLGAQAPHENSWPHLGWDTDHFKKRTLSWGVCSSVSMCFV